MEKTLKPGNNQGKTASSRPTTKAEPKAKLPRSTVVPNATASVALATTTSKNRTAPDNAPKRTALPASKSTLTVKATSTTRKPSSSAKPRPPVSQAASVATSSSSTSSIQTPEEDARVNPNHAEPEQDDLQVAAQLYSWMYMTSTLKRTYETVQENSRNSIRKFETELEEEQRDIADQRVRFETEKLIEFYEELEHDSLISSEIFSIVDSLARLEDSCTRLTSNVITLSGNQMNAPIQEYNVMLLRIETLKAELSKLKSSATSILSRLPNSPVLIRSLNGCVLLLDSLGSNVDSMRMLVVLSKDNMQSQLWRESMAITEGGRGG